MFRALDQPARPRRRRVRAAVAIVAALVSALAAAGPAAAGTYDSAVLADTPTMYWRLGEADGASTAADSSGHGFALAYQPAAVLDVEAGIANETDTSLFDEGGTGASATFPAPPSPQTFETWLRTNPADGTANLYTFDNGNTVWNVNVGVDGLVHAVVYNDVGILERMNGPSVAVTDGFWHYVVADFTTGYIYVDLTQGPPPIKPVTALRLAFANGAAAATALPATVSLGGLTGQLDEVAVYTHSLDASRRSAHAAAGGLGWDSSAATGGEESSPPGCFERGLFWKGAANQTGTSNYAAFGSLNYITTKKQQNRCGTAPPPGSTKKPTFISGQTVRVKLNQDVENYYVEWGPVQFLCNPRTTCWGLFFNFKLATGPNDVCFVSFASGGATPVLDNCPLPSSAVTQALAACTPTGTHGWKLQHEGSSWVAYFLCDTAATPQNWLQVFTHADFGWASGWPDVEGFNQGLKCGGRTAPTSCWRREGFMGETHSNFQWRDGGGGWNAVAFGVCRVDRSVRWDAKQLTTPPPISIQIFENHRATGC